VRSKKTIRRMTPLAGKLAHLTRAMASNTKRLDYLTEEVQSMEMLESAATKALAASLHGLFIVEGMD
jgi:uncharacterized coiled-coil protein SlyX